MKIHPKWREIIDCRICKRLLVVYLGDAFLRISPQVLRGEQRLYIAGASDGQDRNICWYTTCRGIEEISLNLTSNAEEADTRVWLHVLWAVGEHKLVFSPDADVYHIGMLLAHNMGDVLIQLNPFGRDLKLLSMHKLLKGIVSDPDLYSIAPEQRSKILVMLYITTGCDFTSFFVGMGKTTFLKNFFGLQISLQVILSLLLVH